MPRMISARRVARLFCACLVTLAHTAPSLAMPCARLGDTITCPDGRVGLFRGDAIAWSDGSTSRLAPHPSVRIGHPPSVRVGPGVFVGDGRGGRRPLDDPTTADSARCAEVDGVAYCH